MRAGRFGDYLAALLAAHDLADHVVQTDKQAAAKAQDWRAMAGHVSSYTAVQGAALGLLAAAGVRTSWPRALAAVAFSAGSHAFLDRRWPVRRALELTGSPGFARSNWINDPLVSTNDGDIVRVHGQPLPLHGPYLADQALHHACLAVCAAILAGGR